MPLVVWFKPEDVLTVNGARIKNIGNKGVKIAVLDCAELVFPRDQPKDNKERESAP